MNMRFPKFRLPAVLLLLCFLSISCSAFSLTAFASDTTGTCGAAVTWSYNETSKKLTLSGSGDMTNYASASEVPWNAYRSGISMLEIGAGITGIGSYAFYNCTSLASVDLKTDENGAGVRTIGNFAFWMCTSMEEIKLPSSLTSVGEQAFAFCTGLKTLELLNISSISPRAFLGCTALTQVVLEGPITEIGADAFMNCSSVTGFAYPETVKASHADLLASVFHNTAGISEEIFSTVKSEGLLTVNYVDEAGNELAPPYTQTIQKGETYSVVSPEIEGYLIPAGRETITGVMPGADFTETVVYQKSAEETTSPSEETTTSPEETTPVPETPKSTAILLIVLLVIILAAIAVGGVLLVRSNKQVASSKGGVRKNGSDGKNSSGKKKK